MYGREAELIRSAQQGDDQAFGELIRPQLDRAYHLALRTLGRPQDAEDAVQDALYKAWRALPRFRGDARFVTWLHRIVWRTCADRARREEAAPLVAEVEVAGTWRSDDPEERLADRETRDEVERALGRLPVRYRAVLTLFYLEELSLREVAGILDLPPGTVKTHLHRARRALRGELTGTVDEKGGPTEDGASK